MKRILLFSLVFATINLTAQDLTSGKGENYLPESGDWSIGFDATSFLNFAGNLFNSNASAPSASEPMMSQTIYGKLFSSDDQAWRATLGINMGSNTSNSIVTGYDQTGLPTATNVTDETKVSQTKFVLGLGKEFRRGSTRLQGLYGAEALFSLESGSTTYTYGNTLLSEWNAGVSSSRNTEVKTGGTLGVTVRAFIGAEYFIAPKISLTAEYGWGVSFSSTAGGSTTSESIIYDTLGNPITSTTEVDGAGSSSFNLGNDLGLANGMLGLMLHF